MDNAHTPKVESVAMLKKVVDAFTAMTETEKTQFMRYLLRLKNNDRKVMRLQEMFEKGQISRGQLLAAM